MIRRENLEKVASQAVIGLIIPFAPVAPIDATLRRQAFDNPNSPEAKIYETRLRIDYLTRLTVSFGEAWLPHLWPHLLLNVTRGLWDIGQTSRLVRRRNNLAKTSK